MRFKTVLSFSTLAAFVATLAIGCSPGTEVPLAKAPPFTPPKPEPVPKDVKQGGGPGSSGNAKMDPSAEIVK
jgi:hypothetical protein